MAWIIYVTKRIETPDVSKMAAVVLVIEYKISAFDGDLLEKKVVRLTDRANNNAVVDVIN